MRVVLTVSASLLMSAFVAVFYPNEYVWMQQEYGVDQIPEDPDMMFKLGGVLLVHALVQLVALLLLLRAGRKLPAIGLALIAAAAAAMLLQRV